MARTAAVGPGRPVMACLIARWTACTPSPGLCATAVNLQTALKMAAMSKFPYSPPPLRHTRRRLLVARHHDFDLVLLVIQRFVDAPSVTTGNPKDMVNARFLQYFHDAVNGLHNVLSPGLV